MSAIDEAWHEKLDCVQIVHSELVRFVCIRIYFVFFLLIDGKL